MKILFLTLRKQMYKLRICDKELLKMVLEKVLW